MAKKKAAQAAKAAPQTEEKAIIELSKQLQRMGVIAEELSPEVWGTEQGYACIVFGRGAGGGRAIAEVSLRKNPDGTWRLAMTPMTWVEEIVKEAGFPLGPAAGSGLSERFA